MKKAFVAALLVVAAVPLLIGVASLPPHGDPSTPVHTHVSAYYLENGVEQAGTTNIVTAVILNYRGIDTSGEVIVIFTALAAVMVVLLPARAAKAENTSPAPPVPLSPVVGLVVRLLSPFIIIFALYVMTHGHSSPGGGFQAGAVLGGLFIASSVVLGAERLAQPLARPAASWLRVAAPIAFVSMGVLGIALTGYFLGYPQDPGLHAVREGMVTVIEFGIGIGGAMIFATMFVELEAQ